MYKVQLSSGTLVSKSRQVSTAYEGRQSWILKGDNNTRRCTTSEVVGISPSSTNSAEVVVRSKLCLETQSTVYWRQYYWSEGIHSLGPLALLERFDRAVTMIRWFGPSR